MKKGLFPKKLLPELATIRTESACLSSQHHAHLVLKKVPMLGETFRMAVDLNRAAG